LTAICDPLTNTCGCNSNTNFLWRRRSMSY
jgi:hypothetical protein